MIATRWRVLTDVQAYKCIKQMLQRHEEALTTLDFFTHRQNLPNGSIVPPALIPESADTVGDKTVPTHTNPGRMLIFDFEKWKYVGGPPSHLPVVGHLTLLFGCSVLACPGADSKQVQVGELRSSWQQRQPSAGMFGNEIASCTATTTPVTSCKAKP